MSLLPRRQPPVASRVGMSALFLGAIGLIRPKYLSEKLDRQLKDYLHVRHVFKLSSGKAALVLLLRALRRRRPERFEVIVPGYTCFSVPSAVVFAGLTPVPCDIDPRTLDFAIDRLVELVSDRTLCVVSCSLFGIPSDIDSIYALCKQRGAFVVDDAAQAFGGEQNGRKLGTRGDAGIFSLGRGKAVSAGSGGVLVCDSDEIAIEVERDYASVANQKFSKSIIDLAVVASTSLMIRPQLFWLPASIPQLGLGETRFYDLIEIRRLSGVSSGLMHGWQRRLQSACVVRRRNCELYRSIPLSCSYINRASGGLLRFPVLMNSAIDKAELMSSPLAPRLGFSSMYPSSTDEIPELARIVDHRTCPNASDVAKRLVSLPTHGYLSDREVREICELLCSTAFASRDPVVQ